MNLTCAKCKQTKPDTEFYNCKSRKTGKQPNCKLCNKEYRKIWYKEINPDYFWGKDGYFVRRYAQTREYQIKYTKADKDCIVYKLTFQDGDIYIGYTKRSIGVRMLDHRTHWRKYLREPDNPKNLQSSLFKAFVNKGLNQEQIQEVLDSVEIIKKFPGTKYRGLKAEKQAIIEHANNGYTLVNIQHNTKK